MFTVFEYCYRDSGNFKAYGKIWLTGRLTGKEQSSIIRKMEGEEFFVAEQIGIEPLYSELEKYSDGPTEADHAWHEFCCFESEPKVRIGLHPGVWGTVNEFVRRFSMIEAWQPELSKNFCSAIH